MIGMEMYIWQKQMFIYVRRVEALSDMSEIISLIIALHVDRRLTEKKEWNEEVKLNE